ncbi:hypothetical protein [Azospirillum brasilense]|uniref:hypothetical protein n=1 Tax=Azospirillum brasilense TaxID=192 RepID=UPI001ED9D8A3|nr:hypothetical protein [Azospirillum brasilense]UKJ75457.1 hypothetical protein H1Q64_14490 [Azospirillum brasilense]
MDLILEDLPLAGDPLAPLRAVRLNSWLSGHGSAVLSSNVGSAELPFQRWFHFKEAFSPKLVIQALKAMPREVKRVADPCGGSGTTSLTCSMMNMECQTIEVNPFLADLIRAKNADYQLDALYADIAKVLNAPPPTPDFNRIAGGPATLVEPGVADRWVFNRDVAGRVLSFLQIIEMQAAPAHTPLFRVLLGSVLVGVSNVVINGKGRRYRSGWKGRRVTAYEVESRFKKACLDAASDIARFGSRRTGKVRLLEGDARQRVHDLEPIDCALFSPPYPNSFDYTDIYNLELWMLGYLSAKHDNTVLRGSTIHSHVQVHRTGRKPQASSAILDDAYEALSARREALWNRNIPDMIVSYCADMEELLEGLASRVIPGGGVAIVVGGSSYAGLTIDIPEILVDLGKNLGLQLRAQQSLRAMRLSAQQGGQHKLAEDLLVFEVAR